MESKFDKKLWWFNSDNPAAFKIYNLDSLYSSTYFVDHIQVEPAKLYIKWVQAYFHAITSLHLKSVVEFGSAGGHFLYPLFLAGFDVFGVEGTKAGINTILLQKKIPKEFVLRHDMRMPIQIGRKFDIHLALCTEVAEHIEPPFSSVLVMNLMFSSEGPSDSRNHVHHSNEQPYQFWKNLFEFFGYGMILLPRNVFLECSERGSAIFYKITAFPDISSRIGALEAGTGIRLTKWVTKRKPTAYDIPSE
jgi:hypothetical protein